MKQSIRCRSSKETVTGRSCVVLWKRVALVWMVALLMTGLLGCSVDDLLTPFAGDIPFEQDATGLPDMGVVDDAPIVPNADFPVDDTDLRPFE